ncbi:MAG: ATP-binding protein [Anaerolineae bacterium]|nr:ATP-binding protein [Anaerolineae bacterium]
MEQLLEALHVPIRNDIDVVVACQKGRLLAEQFGFSSTEQFVTATVIAEVAHNILDHAYSGEVILDLVEEEGRMGIVVIAMDEGPGIPDVTMALKDGYSTGHGLGLGLSGARRLMDDFEIETEVGRGTTVTMTKWKV